MISNIEQSITIGSQRLDCHKIINKVILYLDKIIEGFPNYLKTSNFQYEKENLLNQYLTVYLNSQLYTEEHIETFHFTFLTEIVQENLLNKPDIGVFLAGKLGTSKPFFHIECKRLPARNKKYEQEYVKGHLGGIQRYKEGKHGSNFAYSAMIGYIQDQNFEYWFGQINRWINDLIQLEPLFWKETDKLIERDSTKKNKFISTHYKVNNEYIKLYHYWVSLNAN